MGTGSPLQGDLLRQSLRSCLDYARNDVPQFGNFEIAYSTRRMTVDAVLGESTRPNYDLSSVRRPGRVARSGVRLGLWNERPDSGPLAPVE